MGLSTIPYKQNTEVRQKEDLTMLTCDVNHGSESLEID